MRKGLLWVGFGLAGLALALGLSIAAFAITRSEFRLPARPLIHTERQAVAPPVKPSAKPKPHRPKHHHRPTHTPPPPPSSQPPPPPPSNTAPIPASPAPHPTGGGSDDHHPSGDD